MSTGKQYDREYKLQAIKLAKEIGQAKAAIELGIPKNTVYGWVRGIRLGKLDLGPGMKTSESAMTLKMRVCQVKCVSFFRYHKRRCVTSDCWL